MQRRVSVRVHHVEIALNVTERADQFVVLIDHSEKKRRVASTVAKLGELWTVLQTQQCQVLRGSTASDCDVQTSFFASFSSGLGKNFEIWIETEHRLHERNDLLGRHVLLGDGLIVVFGDHHQDMAWRKAFPIHNAHASAVLQKSHRMIVIAKL